MVLGCSVSGSRGAVARFGELNVLWVTEKFPTVGTWSQAAPAPATRCSGRGSPDAESTTRCPRGWRGGGSRSGVVAHRDLRAGVRTSPRELGHLVRCPRSRCRVRGSRTCGGSVVRRATLTHPSVRKPPVRGVGTRHSLARFTVPVRWADPSAGGLTHLIPVGQPTVWWADPSDGKGGRAGGGWGGQAFVSQ